MTVFYGIIWWIQKFFVLLHRFYAYEENCIHIVSRFGSYPVRSSNGPCQCIERICGRDYGLSGFRGDDICFTRISLCIWW